FEGTNLNGGDNTVFIDHATINAVPPAFVDPSFEQPPLGSGPAAYQYEPSGTTWSYAGGGVGVASNGSAFNNPDAPENTQVAFLQRAGGSVSQLITFAAGGAYMVSFLAAQRPNNQQTFEVWLDGQIIGTFDNLTTSSYTLLTTSSFIVAAGVHTLA